MDFILDYIRKIMRITDNYLFFEKWPCGHNLIIPSNRRFREYMIDIVPKSTDINPAKSRTRDNLLDILPQPHL